jgi:hypothetical protein
MDLLERAVTACIGLSYVELADGDSVMDDKYEAARADAIKSMRDFVADEDYEEEIRRAIVYMLNVDQETFEKHLRWLRFPLPKWEPDAARALLQQMWEAIWGHWRVPDFDQLDLEIETGD